VCLDLLLSSSAARAVKTARLLARRLSYRRRNIQVEPGLYECSAAQLLAAVKALPSRYRCVMLVGHNPQIGQLAQRFSAEIQRMPTAAVARFRFDAISWAEVGRGSLVEAEFDCPNRP
jgi:phosphohistidine phosphatase